MDRLQKQPSSSGNLSCFECSREFGSTGKTGVCTHSPVFKNDPLLGLKIDSERYEILSVIGIGGWSTVYKAQDKKLHRLVAIKILHSQHAVDQIKLQRFQQEAEAASVLTHSNLAVIHDFGTLDEGRPYIVMELVEGLTIADMVAMGERLSTKKCIDVFTQACAGLQAVHDSGLIHRDLKPSNLMVTATGVVKILDFGVAKFTLRDGECLTQTDEAVGTPFYMSPEQCLGKPLDPRSDIYSLACTMYEAITGVSAFHCDSLLECMRMQIKVTPPRLKTAGSCTDIPLALEAVVFKALAKNPAQRFQSMNDMAQALKASALERTPLQEILLGLSLLLRGTRKSSAVLVTVVLATVACLLSINSLMPELVPSLLAEASSLRPTRAIQFPSDRSVGNLSLVTHEGANFSAKRYGVARGTVTVPEEAVVMLQDVPAKEAPDFHFLATLNGEDLQYLYITAMPISAQGLHAIGALTALHSINLDRCQLQDDGFKDVDWPRLGGLDLHDTSLTDKGLLLAASALTKVSWLSLSGTKITDGGTVCLGNWKLLNHVDLSKTLISDDGLSFLSALPGLQTLNLSGTKITDKSVAALSLQKSLKQLDVKGTPLSGAAIDRLKQALPGCVVISG